MKYKILGFLGAVSYIIFLEALFVSNSFAQDEILPIGQIRNIGIEKSIQPELEKAYASVEKAASGVKGLEKKDEPIAPASVAGAPATGGGVNFLPRFLSRKFDFTLQGYVALEGMYDSRQILGYKLNQYVLFPLPQKLDSTGLDINDKSQFNMLAARATLTSTFKGPKIWGAATKALLEGDFTGLNDQTVGLFRVKKAFAQLDWQNTSLMLGQYYHPLCLDELFPETISFGRGIIYDPFCYAPQIKLRHKLDRYEFVLAVSKRFDLEAARRAAMPDLLGQMDIYLKEHVIGFGINYHTEVPRLYSEVANTTTELNSNVSLPDVKTFKTTESISSLYPYIFGGFHFDPFDVRARLTCAENGVVYSLIGGYDVVERNERTDQRIYANTRTIAFWTDIIYNRLSRLEPAVFVGISKNIGTGTNILKGYPEGLDEGITDPDFLTLLQLNNATTGIDYTFICAPRLRVKFGDLHICAELEYTRASFADPATSKDWEDDFGPTGKVVCGKPVNNFRILLSTFYNFEYSPLSREKDYFDTHEIAK